MMQHFVNSAVQNVSVHFSREVWSFCRSRSEGLSGDFVLSFLFSVSLSRQMMF